VAAEPTTPLVMAPATPWSPRLAAACLSCICLSCICLGRIYLGRICPGRIYLGRMRESVDLLAITSLLKQGRSLPIRSRSAPARRHRAKVTSCAASGHPRVRAPSRCRTTRDSDLGDARTARVRACHSGDHDDSRACTLAPDGWFPWDKRQLRQALARAARVKPRRT
jgi:hypothetical protein